MNPQLLSSLSTSWNLLTSHVVISGRSQKSISINLFAYVDIINLGKNACWLLREKSFLQQTAVCYNKYTAITNITTGLTVAQ